MVGREARGDRSSIKLALIIAKVRLPSPRISCILTRLQRFAQISASSRPFTPTVHVLVLPSRLPLDLRLNLRELDDAELASNHMFSCSPSSEAIDQNNNEIPDHMNLLSFDQAENHVRILLKRSMSEH